MSDSSDNQQTNLDRAAKIANSAGGISGAGIFVLMVTYVMPAFDQVRDDIGELRLGFAKITTQLESAPPGDIMRRLSGIESQVQAGVLPRADERLSVLEQKVVKLELLIEQLKEQRDERTSRVLGDRNWGVAGLASTTSIPRGNQPED